MSSAEPAPRVLVVDDDALVRFALVEVLADAGIAAIEASNSMEALSAMSADEDIRLMVTDIDMPGSINGLGLVRLVKDRSPYANIIVISGQPIPKDAALPEGVLYLQKPFSFARFIDLARSCVS